MFESSHPNRQQQILRIVRELPHPNPFKDLTFGDNGIVWVSISRRDLIVLLKCAKETQLSEECKWKGMSLWDFLHQSCRMEGFPAPFLQSITKANYYMEFKFNIQHLMLFVKLIKILFLNLRVITFPLPSIDI
eukprot:TRINITY_DN24657_c0_g1_i1.p1 TRINITY_DN24657_c0_g1~~TRINITY_DN24657_c0_g1_i1.p1  ORF type:complete len:133 (+),score=18.90 TRINITY_DN24657_c0_g1_i1:80-478(+)